MKNTEALNISRGVRISLLGYQIVYLGSFGLFIGGSAARLFHPSGPLIWIVLAVPFSIALVGFGIAAVGGRIKRRDLAEHQRKVKAGEFPEEKPGDPDPQQSD